MSDLVQALGAIKKQQAEVERAVNALETGLAEMVDAIKQRPDDALAASLGAMEVALAEIAEALQQRPDIDKLVAAITSIKVEPRITVTAPKVEVSVPQQPAPQVHIHPQNFDGLKFTMMKLEDGRSEVVVTRGAA